jgi:hypothetical protein
VKTSSHHHARIGVFICVAILSVFATVSLAQSASGYSVAQLKELPKSATITGAITKLNAAGLTSPLAVIELDNELVCEVSFSAITPSGKIKIEKTQTSLKILEEVLDPITGRLVVGGNSLFKTLNVGQKITVSGIFVRKGNGVRLTGQLGGR